MKVWNWFINALHRILSEIFRGWVAMAKLGGWVAKLFARPLATAAQNHKWAAYAKEWPTHTLARKKIYKHFFSREGVQLVYQRPAPDPAGDNSAGGERPAAVHHFPAGQPPPLTAAPALGRCPRPRIRRKGGGATLTLFAKKFLIFTAFCIRPDP